MYYTETTLYLLWEKDTRLHTPTFRERSRSRSPIQTMRTFTRSRSPSPEPNYPISFTNRQPRQYISYDSLEIRNDLEESLKTWRKVPEEYIIKSLNISHSIPYKIIDIFMKNDSNLVFKVLAYQLQLDIITTKVINSMKLSIPIIEVSIVDKYLAKYVANPNSASIRVNLSLSHIPIFILLGRDKFSFTITLNELDDPNTKCFDAFRNLCRSDKVLTELFEKSITQYFDSSREYVGNIVRDFIDL